MLLQSLGSHAVKVTTERGHRAAMDKQGRGCVTGQEPGGHELRMGVSLPPPHSSLSTGPVVLTPCGWNRAGQARARVPPSPLL